MNKDTPAENQNPGDAAKTSRGDRASSPLPAQELGHPLCPMCCQPLDVLPNGRAWRRNLIENPDTYAEWAEGSCALAVYVVQLPVEVWEEWNTRAVDVEALRAENEQLIESTVFNTWDSAVATFQEAARDFVLKHQGFPGSSDACSVLDDFELFAITRMAGAAGNTRAESYDALRQQIAEAMIVLEPSMPESGLVDACRQLKQAYISERDNAEMFEKELIELRQQIAGLGAERDALVVRHNRNWLSLQKLVRHPVSGLPPAALEIEEMIALIPVEVKGAAEAMRRACVAKVKERHKKILNFGITNAGELNRLATLATELESLTLDQQELK